MISWSGEVVRWQMVFRLCDKCQMVTPHLKPVLHSFHSSGRHLESEGAGAGEGGGGAPAGTGVRVPLLVVLNEALPPGPPVPAPAPPVHLPPTT